LRLIVLVVDMYFRWLEVRRKTRKWMEYFKTGGTVR